MADFLKACPQCGERIQPAAVVCRFCNARFGEAPPPPPSSSAGLKIVLIVVAVVVLAPCVIGMAAAIFLPAIARARQQSKMAHCQTNLKQLGSMMDMYGSRFGGSYPPVTGGDFWLALRDDAPPDVFQCPLEGNPTGPGTDYRGPAWDVSTYGDGDPIGADREGNHMRLSRPGGHVLRKSGDILDVSPTDPLWAAAASKTSP